MTEGDYRFHSPEKEPQEERELFCTYCFDHYPEEAISTVATIDGKLEPVCADHAFILDELGLSEDSPQTVLFDKGKGLWTAEIYLDGKKIRKTSKKQSVVKEWLLTQRTSIRDGVFILDSKSTVTDMMQRYLEDVAEHTLKPKTLDSYKYIINLHVLPEIGDVRLTNLRPAHLQSLYAKKLDSGLSKRTVQYIHAVLRRVLNFSVKWGLIVRNPTDAVNAPAPSKKPPETLTVDQINAFLDNVKEHKYFPIYCIAIGCGLREGEILGLRKSDVSLDEAVLQVRQNVISIRGKLSFGEPKSEASRRPVAMPGFVVDALRKPWEEADDLIFTTKTGKPISPRNLLRHFHSSLAEAGLKRVKLHSLRHTFISYLLSQNVPPKDVQVIAGHSSFAVTMDTYGHIIKGAQRQAADKLEGVFGIGKV